MKTSLTYAYVALALVLAPGCGEKPNTDPKRCEPKTCEGEGWQCGTLDDGCGNRVECGTCTAPLICGGGEDPHVCAPCRAETTAAFCARHERDCGPFTGENLCGASRSVNCGTCKAPMTCGGGGLEGRCGSPSCQPESDPELCTAAGRTCGALTVTDKCQQQRSVDCGECPDAAVPQPGPDAAQPAGLDAARPAGLDAATPEPPDAAVVVEPPDADLVVDPPDAADQPLDYDAGVQTCAAESSKAQLLPLDIYFMVDQSGSMDSYVGNADAGTRMTAWKAVTGAIDAFISQPLANVSAGIQYFGLPPSGQAQCTVYSCTKDSDCGAGCGPCVEDYWYYGDFYCSGYSYISDDSCVAADYAKPDVEIAPLPGVAPAIRASLAAHTPNTLTPTSAALEGAILHAKEWAAAHPGHVAIDILATDGNPVGCITDMAQINAIAAAGLNGTPSIRTFVIGVGTSLTNLNGIAAAGGTGQAFLVDTGGNVSQQMVAALNQIRGAALGCTYSIPPPTSGTLDLTRVNVQYTPGSGGSPQVLVQVLDESHCPAGADGWHYDSPTAPKTIVLCSATCQKVQADPNAQVDILIGCATQHCPPTMQCGFGF